MPEGRDVVNIPKSESVKPKIENFLKATGDCLSVKITPAEAFRRISNRPIEIILKQPVETPNISPVEITAEQHQANHEIEEIRKEIIKTSTPPEDKKPIPESLVVRDEYYIQREKELLDLYGGGFIDSHKTQYEEFTETNGQKEKNISTKINSFLQKFRNQIKGRKDAQEFYTVLHQRGYSDSRIVDSIKHLKNLSSAEIALGIDRINKLGLKVDHFEERGSIIKKSASISEEHFESASKELNPYFFLNDLYFESDYKGKKELYGNNMVFTLLDIAQEGKINSDVKNKLELIKAVYMISASSDKKKLGLNKYYSNNINVSLEENCSCGKECYKMIFENQGKLYFDYLNIRDNEISQKDFDLNFKIIYKNISSFNNQKELFKRFSQKQIEELSNEDNGIAFLLQKIVKNSDFPRELIDYAFNTKDYIKSSFEENKSDFFLELFKKHSQTESRNEESFRLLFIKELINSNFFQDLSFSNEKDTDFWKLVKNNFSGGRSINLKTIGLIFENKNNSEFFNQDNTPKSKFYEILYENDKWPNIPPETLSTFSDRDQKIWQLIQKEYQKYVSLYVINQSPNSFSRFSKIVFENKNNSEFFNQEGIPNAKFYETVYKERVYFSEIPPETLLTFSEPDQKFWQNIVKIKNNQSVDYYNLVSFLISNKENASHYFDSDNQPTKELIQIVINDLKAEFGFIKDIVNPKLIDDSNFRDKVFFSLLSKIDNPEIYKFFIEKNDSISQKIISSKNPENYLKQYLSVIDQINSSPSREILKIKNQLLVEILNTANPLETYQKISDIFIKNNLPMVGKIYRVFNALYPPEKIEQTLFDTKLSRVLINNHSPHLRQNIIFNDLLKVNLGSGELSLVNYLNFLNQSASVLEKAKLGDQLSSSENQQLSFFFKKLDTLYDSSLLSRLRPIEPSNTSNLQSKVLELYQKYHVKEGQTISDRVAEMYLSNFGLKTLSEGLFYIKQFKESANTRNLNQTKFSISTGDLIKGVKPENLGNILNFGCVAGEYLGSDAGSDVTPFDTDVIKSDQEYIISDYQKIAATDYGDLFIVIKDRGQLQDTTDISSPKYDPLKLEIFHSGVVDKQHYGIRTGFPSSEIDFLIIKNTEPQILENIFYEIAKHGVYIPVLNGEGERIFTPLDYQRYRHSFDGVQQFDGDPIKIEKIQPKDIFYQEIYNLKKSIQSEVVDDVSRTDAQIKEKIKTIFDSLGINFKDQFDTSILGSRLYNIGSSGRHTNLPGDFDFDYNIVLDANNYPKVSEIIDEIRKQFFHQGKIDSVTSQIRLTGVTNIGPEPIDLDIGINTTASTLIFASHEAIEQKLDSIKQSYGEDTYYDVVANILLAKKILKENHAYKKGDNQDGGFGGIGTENWILSNNGSIQKAFETFWQTSHNNGRELTLDEFRKKYFILDSGENLRDTGRNHDNFIFSLTEKGYRSMLKAIGKYIK